MKLIKKNSVDELVYRCKKCSEMTNQEINETAELFSNHYGVWSQNCPDQHRRGRSIRFTTRMIKSSFVDKPDRYVAMVYYKDTLIAHVFYMMRNIDPQRYVIWMLQLVVNKKYRGQHVGTKLMHSIWGLSDAFAWGLYTSNPLTINALEEATMRKVNVKLIDKYIGDLKKVAYDLFDNDTKWLNSYHRGVVDTNFWTDHSEICKKIEYYESECSRGFPLNKNLAEGHEWFAFTFRTQPISLRSREGLDSYYSFSNSALIDAYSKMRMGEQKWASFSVQEVDKIVPYLKKGASILDIGCGQGRHSKEFAKRGYQVVGIDFSTTNINHAKQDNDTTALFHVKDARHFYLFKKFDVALCMYDVIGSYPSYAENKKIVRKAYQHLKFGGKLFLSVLNATLTESLCRACHNIVQNEYAAVDRIMTLKGSNTMQKTGNIFDGSKIVMDISENICYRKEQFFAPDSLTCECLVRDMRFTKESISAMLQEVGFVIDDIFYFQAGHISSRLEPTNSRAKEIFVIAHKPALFERKK